jgi:hypothetical protein
MDENRRNILKMFGIGAAAGVAGVAPLAAVAKTDTLSPKPTMLLTPPEGMTYQWKRVFITADEPDMDNIFAMIRAGWKPVPMRRHLEHFRPGTADSDVNVMPYWIEVGGVVLMEMPSKDIPLPRPHPLPWECRDASS